MNAINVGRLFLGILATLCFTANLINPNVLVLAYMMAFLVGFFILSIFSAELNKYVKKESWG